MATIEPESAAPEPRPWGGGMTLLLGFLIFLGYSIVQGLALAPLLVMRQWMIRPRAP